MIVLAGTAAAQAALQATRTIPIVATVLGDPVVAGLVSSLARPGGNLTGLAWQASDPVTKQLQLLQEIAPGAERLAVLGHAANPSSREAVETAARILGLKLDVLSIAAPAEIPGALDEMSRRRARMLLVLPSPMFFAERRRLSELAVRHRLPAVYEVKEYVDDGGLLVRPELFGHVSTLGQFRASDPQGRPAERLADGAAHEVRAGPQPADCHDAWPEDPTRAPAPR